MFGFKKKEVARKEYPCSVCGFVYVAQIAVSETESICVLCFLKEFEKANG